MSTEFYRRHSKRAVIVKNVPAFDKLFWKRAQASICGYSQALQSGNARRRSLRK
jgi:hypothetical protein